MKNAYQYFRNGPPEPSLEGGQWHACRIAFLDCDDEEVHAGSGLVEFADGKICVQVEHSGRTRLYNFHAAKRWKLFAMHRAAWSIFWRHTCPIARAEVQVTRSGDNFTVRIEPLWPYDDIDSLEMMIAGADVQEGEALDDLMGIVFGG